MRFISEAYSLSKAIPWSGKKSKIRNGRRKVIEKWYGKNK